MESNEVRIGNWVTEKGISSRARSLEGPFQVEIHDMSYHLFLDPIPLTEQWLLRFGFSRRLDTLFMKFFFTISEVPNGYKLWITHGTYGKTIKYVHELQNLFFILDGTELELSDKLTEKEPDNKANDQ